MVKVHMKHKKLTIYNGKDEILQGGKAHFKVLYIPYHPMYISFCTVFHAYLTHVSILTYFNGKA